MKVHNYNLINKNIYFKNYYKRFKKYLKNYN